MGALLLSPPTKMDPRPLLLLAPSSQRSLSRKCSVPNMQPTVKTAMGMEA